MFVLTIDFLERVQELEAAAESVLEWEKGDYIPGNLTAGELARICGTLLALVDQFGLQIPVAVDDEH